MTRRDFYRFATIILNGLMGLVLAVPAIAYLMTPFRRKGRELGSRAAGAVEPIESGSSAILCHHRRTAGCLGQISCRAGRVSLADPPAGGKPARGARVYLGVSSPGMCRQPDRRWQGLLVSLPHQFLRLGRKSTELRSATPDGSTRGRARRWGRSRGAGEVSTVSDPQQGEDSPCLSNWLDGSMIGPAGSDGSTALTRPTFPAGRDGGTSSVRP